MEMTKEELINLSMEIILHAGNARTLIHKALEGIASSSFESAQEALKSAHEEIKQAHAAQTKTIQKEANGYTFENSILFSHAQDTLMTIFSEYTYTVKMIKIFENYELKIKNLKEQINE